MEEIHRRPTLRRNKIFVVAPKEIKNEDKSLDNPLKTFLKETEEINDIIIIDKNGECVYLNSRNEIFNQSYIKKYRKDFR